MSIDNNVTIGDHFSEFVKEKIKEGRFESVGEVIRAGLRLLEVEEARLELLNEKILNDKQQAGDLGLELVSEKPLKDNQQTEMDENSTKSETNTKSETSTKSETNTSNDFMHELTDLTDLSGYRKNKLV